MQDEPNGILPLILGEVNGRPLGLVRIKYRLMRHRHGKSENWFWTAVHAEKVPESLE